jgi:hypothetical protein
METLKMNVYNPSNFPIDSFPPLIRNAVLEVQANTGFPLPMIASSALGAVAAACQNSIDVQLPLGALSPTSLHILVIADSGEGKTPTDRYFTKPIHDFEENEARKLELTMTQQKTYRSTWEIERKEIEAAIQKNRKKNITNDDPEKVDLLNKEFENLQQTLENHLSMEPRPQPRYKIFHSNTTPAKIALDLYENWPSAYLCSDEAGSLFRGGALSDLGMINQLWDGATLTVDRISSPSFQVKNSRLSIFVAVQSAVLQDYLLGRGKGFRYIGALARHLVVYPISTKGSRILSDGLQFSEYLTVYQQRITEIMTQDKLESTQGRQEKLVLKFSEEGKQYWYAFRNQVEYDLNPGRYLSDIDDFASKITTNLARIAALFHYFEGQEGDISLETVSRAGAVCEWFIHEFKRLFSSMSEIPLEVADALELERFLMEWCSRHSGQPYILKSLVAQYGPNQLRPSSNKERREYAINQLVMEGKIWIVFQGKKKIIQLNPQYFPIYSGVLPYQPAISY